MLKPADSAPRTVRVKDPTKEGDYLVINEGDLAEGMELYTGEVAPGAPNVPPAAPGQGEPSIVDPGANLTPESGSEEPPKVDPDLVSADKNAPLPLQGITKRDLGQLSYANLQDLGRAVGLTVNNVAKATLIEQLVVAAGLA